MVDINYKECTIQNSKNKDDISVNDIETHLKLFKFILCILSPKSRQMGINDNTFHPCSPTKQKKAKTYSHQTCFNLNRVYSRERTSKSQMQMPQHL